MLETVVAWVLKNYVGEYLEDLNTNQLSLALLSGLLELENVPLKKTALRKLDLPLEVKSGLLGKLTLTVPITSIRSKPWLLTLSDVLVIVGPPDPSKKYDIQAVEELEQQRKDSLLAELEQKHKDELSTLLGFPKTSTQNSWWSASLISAVLSNIQLVMTNVHIRYEDDSTLPHGLAFNCGIKIQKMTVQTTNAAWKAGFIEPQDGQNIFKKLELKGFSLYWNSDYKIQEKEPKSTELRNILAPENLNNSYIIHPCSAELRMERNSSKYSLKSTPRFKLFLKPDKIICELTRRQMAELRALNREWARFEIARQHRKWRPLTSVGKHAKEWWKFAYDRVVEEQRRKNTRRSLDFAFARAKQLNAYCRAYRRRLIDFAEKKPQGEIPSAASIATNVSQEDSTIMKQIEHDTNYTFHELHLFRETVFRQFIAEKEKELGYNRTEETFETIESTGDIPMEVDALPQKQEEGKGLYGWITSFFVAEEPKEEEKDANAEFSRIDLSELKNLPKQFNVKDMEDEILDVLHESWDDSTILRKDAILADISLKLDHITLRFIDSCLVSGVEQRRILALDCSGVSSQLELSPRQHSLSIQLAVEDMSIQRLCTGYPVTNTAESLDESLFYDAVESTKILLAIGKNEKSGAVKEPIFRLLYKKVSPKLTVRHTIEGRFRPISVMYEENALDGLSTLFSDDPNIYKTFDQVTSSGVYASNLIESHVFVNLHIPTIATELRQQGWATPKSRYWEAGEPFLCLELQDVSLGIISKERHITQIKIDLGHAEMSDLLERQASQEVPTVIMSTGKRINGVMKPFSTSCPDITQMDQSGTSPESSSVPNNSYLSNMSKVSSRKVSSFESTKAETQIMVTLIDSKHPQFDMKYKSNCKVDVVLNELTLGMNRRTWTALMDLLGLLDPTDGEKNQQKGKPSAEFIIETSVRLQSLNIDMLYPKNQTRLGFIYVTNPELLAKITVKPIDGFVSANLLIEGLKIEDHMPLYSELYRERLYLINERGIIPSRAEFRITKYLGSDPNRECDLKVALLIPKNMHLYYVHTNRFFVALLDFWLQFNELQDIVSKSKERNNVANLRLSKVLLDLEIESPTTILLPMNQFSEQVVILESSGVAVKNSFVSLSDVEEHFDEHSVETAYGYDENIDCLLDSSKITLFNLTAFEGLRIARMAKRHENVALGPTVCRGVFEDCDFQIMSKNVFDKSFDLTTKIYRNLDGSLSHNAPDMTAIMVITDLRLALTSGFYILFRGVLEKNMGDPLLPMPETIPNEILQRPVIGCEVTDCKKYATFSFRLLFKDIILDCQVPGKICYIPFAEANLRKARISFDTFIDGGSELDVISESTELIDSRVGADENLYKTILRPIEDISDDSTTLMFEAHMMMRKDETPLLTLVLMNSRVLVLPEWLNDAKDFLNLSTEFIPKYWEDMPQLQGGVIERLNSSHVASTVGQTLALKITLRNSNLYLLENPFDAHSFACVATITAVLNMSDPGGDMNANLEIQSITLGWCAMNEEANTMNLCSNDFAVSISLSSIANPGSIPGLPIIAPKKQFLDIELRGVIGRLAYKDFTVLLTAVKGFLKHSDQHFGNSLIPKMKNAVTTKPLTIDKIGVRAERIDVWFLDEYKGVSVPMLRFSLSDLHFEKQPDRIIAHLHISVDYFNNRMFGWEPLVEKWKILRFVCQTKDKLKSMELVAESQCPLNITLTEQFMQQTVQFMDRWPAIKASHERDDFRHVCAKSKADHLPYIMKNETGCEVVFTTAILGTEQGQCKTTSRWVTLPPGKAHYFAFPSKLLLYSSAEREPPRQLLLRVTGWDEITPVSVDASGTYCRVVKSQKSGIPNARLVIKVQMEKDGRKLVSVRSSMDITNSLPDPVKVFIDGGKKEIMTIEPATTLPVSLPFAHHTFQILPVGSLKTQEKAEIAWKGLKGPGEVKNRIERLTTVTKNINYWLCTTAKRELYPEDDILPGHALTIVAPLSIQNLLPIDLEVRIQEQVFAIGTGKLTQIISVNATKEVTFTVATDRLVSLIPYTITKSAIGEGQTINVKLRDVKGRLLDLYANVTPGIGLSFMISFWVPYWIVNKSGIPLIIKQEATQFDAAGQMEEHESAKDKHPLMFSFYEDGCPKQCVARVGRYFVKESGFSPKYGSKFSLTPGVQAIKLKLEHATLPTLYYNIGVEVRAGTGRYKDTQVVLLTSRFIINNQSTHTIYVCHYDLIDRPSEHVLVASQSSLVWNEKVENQKQLCIRRYDVKHWSCPIRLDRVGSFHVTMRDADETPQFVRVEISLNSAVFSVTFTDSLYYPPPIRIENLSDVPVLYQQQAKSGTSTHLRTICKANSHVDYAWDDLYGNKYIVLQVYENKSHVYDPTIPGQGSKLVYENNMFIQLASSFKEVTLRKNKSEECELVLETLQKGKVTLNKQNKLDANGSNQLWKLCDDGCIENIGMTARSRKRVVLDVLDKTGNQLMMAERNPHRDIYQKWIFSPDGRLILQLSPGLMLTSRGTDVVVSGHDEKSPKHDDGIAVTQQWRISRQRPGSGSLCVECLHRGPTMVVQIKDEETFHQLIKKPMANSSGDAIDITITMRAGLGLSLVNGLYEELLYAHFGGIVAHGRIVDNSYQSTINVDVIQVDNQLLEADNFKVVFCQAESPDDIQLELPPGVPSTAQPALKLEMNCCPEANYTAFECFRIKLCNVQLVLNELLLWKMVQFVQASDAALSVQEKALTLPPNTDLERPDPLRTRRLYFGTLNLEMGEISLSVVTVPKSSLPPACRELKQQFNIKLISFENATVYLPPFRQFHYFETSSFLFEAMQKFYLAELSKQTVKFVFTLDAFGNPQGFLSEMKDSFQGLVIEGDVQRFVAGLGYGVSNSISKMASSLSTGVGSFTYDQNHEAKRRNMIRSQSASATPLSHLYSGVKGLGIGVIGGVSAIVTNTIHESKKDGLTGAFKGIYKGAVDTITKPVQGVFDFVEGTASALKSVAESGVSQGTAGTTRVRPPRVCRDLYHLLSPYSEQLAKAQMELLRINGFSTKERLLDMEICLEQILNLEHTFCQYALISTKQVYICKQEKGEPSNVVSRLAYKYIKSVQAKPEIANTLARIEVLIDSYDHKSTNPRSIWCSRFEVARRLVDKILRAKHEYDHNKRTLATHKN